MRTAFVYNGMAEVKTWQGPSKVSGQVLVDPGPAPHALPSWHAHPLSVREPRGEVEAALLRAPLPARPAGRAPWWRSDEAGPTGVPPRDELRTPQRRRPEGPEPPPPQDGAMWHELHVRPPARSEWPASEEPALDDGRSPGALAPRPPAPTRRPLAWASSAPCAQAQARFHRARPLMRVRDGQQPTVAAGPNPPTAQPYLDDGRCQGPQAVELQSRGPPAGEPQAMRPPAMRPRARAHRGRPPSGVPEGPGPPTFASGPRPPAQ